MKSSGAPRCYLCCAVGAICLVFGLTLMVVFSHHALSFPAFGVMALAGLVSMVRHCK